ncbi:hypothetical protein SAMN02910278_01806 [Peptostreptococcus sp. D1]|nr:hypothetical protein SAMN02910278_01806 [Peptostreptococcus sp. D1]
MDKIFNYTKKLRLICMDKIFNYARKLRLICMDKILITLKNRYQCIKK